jgi:hypothetical protein
MLKTYMWSIGTYRSETWNMGVREVTRLTAFQNCHCRWFLRMSPRETVTNDQVRIGVGDERCFFKWIKHRGVQLIGHVVQHENKLKWIIECVIGEIKS